MAPASVRERVFSPDFSAPICTNSSRCPGFFRKSHGRGVVIFMDGRMGLVRV